MRITINPVFDIETMQLIGHDGQYDYDGPVELCRGETQKAWNQSQIAKSNAGLQAAQGYGAAAGGELGTAATGYQDLINNPMSAEERAGRLSAAGGAYDALGQKAGERVAKTRNTAGYGALLDQLARGKSATMDQTQSQLDTEAYNRRLAGLGGISGLYGTNVGAQTNLLRPGQPVQTPGFWDQFVLTAMGNAQKAAEAYAGG